MNDRHRTPDNPAGYEHRDVNPRLPLALALFVLILLAAALAAIAWGFHLRAGPTASVRVPAFFDHPLTPPHAPRLQASPGDDLQRMRAISSAGLHRYGWVDKPAGVVHIPIDHAMALYVQRHSEAGDE